MVTRDNKFHIALSVSRNLLYLNKNESTIPGYTHTQTQTKMKSKDELNWCSSRCLGLISDLTYIRAYFGIGCQCFQNFIILYLYFYKKNNI